MKKINVKIIRDVESIEEPLFGIFVPRMFLSFLLSVFLNAVIFFFYHDFEYIKEVLLTITVVITGASMFKMNGNTFFQMFLLVITNTTKKKVLREPKKIQAGINDYVYSLKNSYETILKIKDINYSMQDYVQKERIFSQYISALNKFSKDFKFRIIYSSEKYKEEDIKHCYINSKNELAKEFNDIMHKRTIHGGAMKTSIYIVLTKTKTGKEKTEDINFLFEKEITNVKFRFQKINTSLESHVELELIKHDKAINLIHTHLFGKENAKVLKHKWKTDSQEGSVFGIVEYGDSISESLLTDLRKAKIEFDFLIRPRTISLVNAKKLLKSQKTQLEMRIFAENKRKERERGYFLDDVPKLLGQEIEHIEYVESILTDDRETMYKTNILINIKSKNQGEQRKNEAIVQEIFSNYDIGISKLSFQQSEAINMFLNGTRNGIRLERIMMTENIASFIPFSCPSLNHQNGIYLGVNQVTDEIISFDVDKLANQNGFILGKSGSGKSFNTKMMILQKQLDTKQDLFIIDPEGEYVEITKKLGGEVITISPTSQTYMNIFEIAEEDIVDYITVEKVKKAVAFDELVKIKIDQVINLIGIMVNPKEKLTSIDISILDRALRKCYKTKAGKVTLVDLRKELEKYTEEEAKKIYKSLEIYTEGSLAMFSNLSNINTSDRFICFDISSIGENLKELGMMIVFDWVWRRTLKNRALSKRTNIFADEIHVCFKNPNVAGFLLNVWKRIRKYKGIPIGITQDVEDLLLSDEARGMLANSEFLILLSQSATPQKLLTELLQLNDSTASLLSLGQIGNGVIKFGSDYFLFDNVIEKDKEIWKVLNTSED